MTFLDRAGGSSPCLALSPRLDPYPHFRYIPSMVQRMFSLAIGFTLVAAACAATRNDKQSTEPEMKTTSYAEAIQAIARDIEDIATAFSQLADFSADKHCDPERLTISYAYHTHRPQGRAGWAGAVPNPDADGIWFHIDFHDPDSMAQIHTQPVVIDRRYGDKRVMFLILEGKETKHVSAELQQILQRNGVVTPGFTGQDE